MTTAKDFFAGLYQEAPKPVMIYSEKEELIFANEPVQILLNRLNKKEPSALLSLLVWKEIRRCLKYYRGTAVTERVGDYCITLYLTPYPYEDQLYIVISVEESPNSIPDWQSLLHILRNSQGKLNSYLNGIYGQAQMLGLESKEGKELGEDVRRILRMANHLYQLLDRQGTYEYTVPVDVGSFTANCVKTANEIEPEAQIKMVPFERDLYVQMMPEETELVLSTLLSNALRFRNRMTLVSVTRRGEQVCITVRDDGRGVESPNMLFSWGYRTADKNGVLGLGFSLVMAKKLLELQGGTLVYEREGDHTCFHIILNAQELPAAGRLAEWQPETTENSLSQMRIELSDYTKEENEE